MFGQTRMQNPPVGTDEIRSNNSEHDRFRDLSIENIRQYLIDVALIKARDDLDEDVDMDIQQENKAAPFGFDKYEHLFNPAEVRQRAQYLATQIPRYGELPPPNYGYDPKTCDPCEMMMNILLDANKSHWFFKKLKETPTTRLPETLEFRLIAIVFFERRQYQMLCRGDFHVSMCDAFNAADPTRSWSESFVRWVDEHNASDICEMFAQSNSLANVAHEVIEYFGTKKNQERLRVMFAAVNSDPARLMWSDYGRLILLESFFRGSNGVPLMAQLSGDHGLLFGLNDHPKEGTLIWEFFKLAAHCFSRSDREAAVQLQQCAIAMWRRINGETLEEAQKKRDEARIRRVMYWCRDLDDRVLAETVFADIRANVIEMLSSNSDRKEKMAAAVLKYGGPKVFELARFWEGDVWNTREGKCNERLQQVQKFLEKRLDDNPACSYAENLKFYLGRAYRPFRLP